MNINDYTELSRGEKPLDRIVADGGLCSIFRTIGCIGDSLSSGEFESEDETGAKGYHDMFEYSWGQFIARSTGCRAFNFSRGGMTASEYWNSYAQEKGWWSPDKLCQAYIIALGVNDLFGLKQEPGTLDDIDLSDYSRNADTFAGYYARIIQRLKVMSPNSVFFLVTMPRENNDGDTLKQIHAGLLEGMAGLFPDIYVIDLFTYAPVYDEQFKKRFYLRGHLNPAGYLLTARMLESYIDYIIRSKPGDFSQVGFIGTPYYRTDL